MPECIEWRKERLHEGAKFEVDFESRDRNWISVNRIRKHVHFQRLEDMKSLRSLIGNQTLLLLPKEYILVFFLLNIT